MHHEYLMKIDSKASALHFVYPFLFETDSFPDFIQQLDTACWRGSKRDLLVWKKQVFPDDDLLPHVARFLNPLEGTKPTAKTWSLTNEALQSHTAGIGSGHNRSSVTWTMTTSSLEIPFQIRSVQLIMFQIGVGFLSIVVAPDDRSDNPDQWLNLLHYFRFTRGQRNVAIKAVVKCGPDRAGTNDNYEPFFPSPMGGLALHPDGKGYPYDLISGLLKTAVSHGDPWWKEVFVPGKCLPFSILFMDGIPEASQPEYLYRIRNFFHSEQIINPTEKDLDLNHPSLTPYGKGQWFTFSLDGGNFAAFDPPKTQFHRQVLPDHLSKNYFLGFLLALHQRFALMMLVDKVAEAWPQENVTFHKNGERGRRETIFTQIREQLLFFTASGYYAQALQQDKHHHFYLKWQEIFQVERLYQEVSDEIRYMHEALQVKRDQERQAFQDNQRRRSEYLDKKLNLFAWLFLVPSLLLSLFEATGGVGRLPGVLILIAGLLLGGFVFWLLNRSGRKDEQEL
jgi:hypothetical protein